MSSPIAQASSVTGERAAIVAFDEPIVSAEWMEEAAQAIAGRAAPCRLQDRLDDGDQGWWIIGDGEVVGALCGRLVHVPSDAGSRALIWTWLAIDARWRAFGYGGAAVPLLEQAAHQAGAELALAPLPPDNGVALYFWLRLGYTPLRSVAVDPDDRPKGVAPDALWMQRPLDPLRSPDPCHAEEKFMSLVLPDEIHDRVNGALDEGFPMCMVAVSSDSQPVVSFRGSTQTFGDDALAIWVRGEQSSTLNAIADNPSVALMYTNMPSRKFFIFRGQAVVTTDQTERDRIWEGQHDLEKGRDMERTGTAVVIRLDSVQGSGVNLTRG